MSRSAQPDGTPHVGGLERGRATAAVALVALVASAPCGTADAEVYKWTDPSGRIVYSDKPPPDGRAPGTSLAPVPHPLAGRWRVANVAMNGELRIDDKLLGSAWTFGDRELAIQPREGAPLRFSLRMEPGAQPRIR